MANERDTYDSKRPTRPATGERRLRPEHAAQGETSHREVRETPALAERESASARLRPVVSEGTRAVERVRPLIPELRLPPPSQADWQQAAYSADSCRAMSKILKSEYALMVTTRETKLDAGQAYRGAYDRHFQGDLGEVTAQIQYRGFGKAEILNTPGKHDNHPYVDLAFTSDSGTTKFSGDMKVSLTDRPQDYYMRKLAAFDTLVRDGRLAPAEAQLFVPHDHVPALREAVEKRFGEASTEHSAECNAWLARIHETGLSSGQYQTIMELCASPTDQRRMDIDRVKTLAADLDTAADYIDGQLGRMGRS